MTWLSIALLLLRIADNLIAYVRDKKQFDAGMDTEIAKVSASILSKTESAKKVMEEINAMSGDSVDLLLHKLEQPPG